MLHSQRLKRIIVLHNETRVSRLQKIIMKININKLNKLMKQLVAEQFLSEPETRQSGYKLIADEDEIRRFKEK